jgi:histidinol-phosphate/aromatic aminotransferase/cobyric acid decarboxylase-like protein
MIRAELPRVVVLLSPSKLFGSAGTRPGAMWTQDLALRGAVAARRLNWPTSYLDAVVASTALRSSDCVERTHSALLSTATDMESLLALWHPGAVTGVPVRYRFVATAEPLAAHQAFVDAGGSRACLLRRLARTGCRTCGLPRLRRPGCPGWPGCRLVSNRSPSCCSVPSCSAGR